MTDNASPSSDLRQVGKELHQAIDFGFQVQAFLASEIGQYLVKRAEDEIEAAVEELKCVNAFAPDAIRTIQGKVQVAERFQYWLADAYQAGVAAQEQLIDQQP